MLAIVPSGAYLGALSGTGATSSDGASVNSAASSTQDYFGQDSFMDYLQTLFATTDQENAENRLYNSEEAELARKFSADEAQKNRDFMKMMSDTSYQRAVVDLQKAGLNPILAYQQGGASTPNSATPSSPSASYQHGGGDTLTGILNSFAHLISSAADIGKMVSSFLPNVSKIFKYNG